MPKLINNSKRLLEILGSLPARERAYLLSEYAEEIRTLREVRTIQDIGDFEVYAGATALRDFIMLAQEGSAILPEEVAQWVTSKVTYS